MALSPPSPGQYDEGPAAAGFAERDEWPEALERRDGARARSHVEVEVEIEGALSHVSAEVVNHGPGGFYLECGEEFGPGSKVTVICRGKRRQAEIVHERKVPRSLTGMRRPGVGVRLID